MSSVKAVLAGALIDGTGAEPVKDAVVVFEGKSIVAAGRASGVDVPKGAEVTDCRDLTLMPGLIEAHCHPNGERSLEEGFRKYYDNVVSSTYLPIFKGIEVLRTMLRWGYTTCRILHGAIPSAPEMRGEHLVAMRTAAERRYFPSPRIVAAGTVFPSAGHMHLMAPPSLISSAWAGADGVDEVRKQTRLCLDHNVDVVKLLGPTGGGGGGLDGPKVQGMTYDEIRVAVEEAHFKGVPVAAHAHGGSGLKAAVEAGVDSIEHGTYLCEEPELLRMMAKNRQILVPTVGLRIHPKYGWWEAAKKGIPTKEKSEEELDAIECSFKSVRMAKREGVRVAAGTDFMRYDISPLAYELEVYHRYCGLTAMEALVAGTKTAAEACNLRRTGTIEAGKTSDLIAVAGDPLKDITVLQRMDAIRHVWKEGYHEVRDGRINW